MVAQLDLTPGPPKRILCCSADSWIQIWGYFVIVLAILKAFIETALSRMLSMGFAVDPWPNTIASCSILALYGIMFLIGTKKEIVFFLWTGLFTMLVSFHWMFILVYTFVTAIHIVWGLATIFFWSLMIPVLWAIPVRVKEIEDEERREIVRAIVYQM